jgi:hypothetical protein
MVSRSSSDIYPMNLISHELSLLVNRPTTPPKDEQKLSLVSCGPNINERGYGGYSIVPMAYMVVP